MVKIELNKNDLKTTLSRFARLDKIADDLPKILGQTAFTAQAYAQANVKKPPLKGPNITGNLKNMIAAQKTENGGVLESKAHYSPYVEFGTGRNVDLDQLTRLGIPESYASQFKGKGIKNVNLPARPFFFPAVRKALKETMNDIEKKINKS